MDATITTEEVTAALGNLPSLDPRPNAVNIRALRVHIERALQLLPCPQSVHHGWKGLAMSRVMNALLVTGGNPFRTPTDPGPAAVYTRTDPTDTTPLTRTEQATIDATFALQKHYFQSYTNISRVVRRPSHGCQRGVPGEQSCRRHGMAREHGSPRDARPAVKHLRIAYPGRARN